MNQSIDDEDDGKDAEIDDYGEAHEKCSEYE